NGARVGTVSNCPDNLIGSIESQIARALATQPGLLKAEIVVLVGQPAGLEAQAELLPIRLSGQLETVPTRAPFPSLAIGSFLPR
ncbi:MAG: hypothetical protein AAFV07_05580, partial [Bacteroidota bacterium]